MHSLPALGGLCLRVTFHFALPFLCFAALRSGCFALAWGRDWEVRWLSMTTLGSVLDEMREVYLSLFRQALREACAQSPRVLPEPSFLMDDGSLAREGSLGLPCRMDVVIFTGETPENVSVDSESLLTFEALNFDWKEVQVRVLPFCWDACQVLLTGLPQTPDWAPLKAWFEHWFDLEDARPADKAGLYGVVHFLSDPVAEAAGVRLHLDLGSAPVAAFEGLLDALVATGAKRLEFGELTETDADTEAEAEA